MLMSEKAHDCELVLKARTSETSGSDLQREVTSEQIPDSVRVKQVLRPCHSGRRAEHTQHNTLIPDEQNTAEQDGSLSVSILLLSALSGVWRSAHFFVCGSRWPENTSITPSALCA